MADLCASTDSTGNRERFKDLLLDKLNDVIDLRIGAHQSLLTAWYDDSSDQASSYRPSGQ